jgi:hypothetical protein
MLRHRSRVALLSVAAVMALITGCVGHAGTSPVLGSGSATTTSASPAAQGVAGCDPASPITSTPSLGPEVRGTGDDATLYGLIMTQKPMPVRAHEDVKIVWRMTGSGPLRLATVSPEARLSHSGGDWNPTAGAITSDPETNGELGTCSQPPDAGSYVRNELPAQRTYGWKSRPSNALDSARACAPSVA